ncbi:MAG: muramoyltetrapeptide carboxypeptidase [Patiriisocius sp.]|jgi:muramoyltetrapeptide carboxypeptidase
MITPSKTKQIGHVRIISSARSISPEEITTSIEIIKDWNCKISFGEHLFAKHHQFAGTIQNRIDDFQTAINDPGVDVILFARGGYGSVQLIDFVSFKSLNLKHKWMVGYSDITVIHSHVHQNFNLASIHGTMPINFTGNTRDSIISLENCLLGGNNSIKVDAHALNRPGIGKGQVVGGNLSILYSLLGSNSDIDTTDKILFIEDLDEYLYHIDRMMLNLKRNGKLSRISALLVGGFTKMNDNDIPYGMNAYEIIKESVKEFDYPVVFDFPAGHSDNNLALYLGVESELISDTKGAHLKQTTN